MSLPNINFLISLGVMRLWSTSTIITQINQAKLTDVNNLLVWRTQSFCHNNQQPHTQQHNTLCYFHSPFSRKTVCICTWPQNTSACFQNLDKVFGTSTRFALLWQGNIEDRENSRKRVMLQCKHVTCAQTTD